MENKQEFEKNVALQANRYVVIKHLRNKDKKTTRLPLPVVIGSSSESDIIINSPSVAKCARVVLATDNKLKIFDFKRRTFIPIEYLQQYDLRIAGPFPGQVPEKIALKDMARELLAQEERWFERLSPKIRKLAGGRLSQIPRLASWGACAAILLISLYAISMRSETVVDRSLNLIFLKKDSLVSSGYGSIPSYREFAYGVSFAVSLGKEDLAKDHLLAFELKGIDFAGEIVLEVNGKRIFSAQASKKCLYEYCSNEVLVPKKLLKQGKNAVKFVHENYDSDFVIKNIMFTEVSDVGPAELVVFERRYEADERAFSERGISHQNIINAKRDLVDLLALLRNRTGVGELKSKVEALLIAVDKETVQIIEELSFQAEKDFQLAKFNEAKDKYKNLLEFYPDPSSKDHRRIKSALNKIEEVSH